MESCVIRNLLEWISEHPAQIISVTLQQQWANAIESIFDKNAADFDKLKALNTLELKLNEQLNDLQQMLRSEIDAFYRTIVGNLIKIIIYNKSRTNLLIENKVLEL